MKYTVNVTKNDIEKGACKDASGCALAIAISRAIGKEVRVHTKKAWWSAGCSSFYAPLPDSAAEFYRAFDRRDSVHPFTFEIEIP